MSPTDARGMACYCDSGKPYGDCCDPILSGLTPATTAEALMRSRYSAFFLGRSDYLLDSWHPETRPTEVLINPEQQWIGLKILHCDAGLKNDSAGTVQFTARYKLGGRGYRLEETSHFVKQGDDWLYHSGDLEE